MNQYPQEYYYDEDFSTSSSSTTSSEEEMIDDEQKEMFTTKWKEFKKSLPKDQRKIISAYIQYKSEKYATKIVDPSVQIHSIGKTVNKEIIESV